MTRDAPSDDEGTVTAGMDSSDGLLLVIALQRATHRAGLLLQPSLERIGITQAEGHVLAYLGKHGASTIAALQADFGHKRSTLTSILDRLESHGLITRQRAEHDHRSYVVTPTFSGEQTARHVLKIYEEVERGLRERCTDRDIAGLLAISRALDALVVDADDETP